MDNQCANIFSIHATVYGSHSAMFAFYWKREYFFFFMCILNLVFFFKKTWFVSFYLSPPPLFFSKTVFPKTCFVFPILIGGAIFLTFMVHRGSCLYFLLLCCVCFLSTFWLSSLCQYVTKRGRHSWSICFV